MTQNRVNNCICRCCGKEYNEYKATADWKGYCTQKCFHENAKKHGYRKGNKVSEYHVLAKVNQVGSVYK